jgi:hypothetical protein
MEGHCFRKRGSIPPLCGVHNVVLAQKQVTDELIALGIKPFPFFVCPVSGTVINDESANS